MKRQDQWIFLDNFRRKLTLKYQLRSRVLKSLFKNKNLSLSQQLFLSLQKSSIPKQSYRTKLSNRCLVTGRNYNTIKKSRTSRFHFRTLGSTSYTPGLKRYNH